MTLGKDFDNLVHVVIVVVDRHREPHVIAKSAYRQRGIWTRDRNLGAATLISLADLAFRRFDIVRDERDDWRLRTGRCDAGVAERRQLLAQAVHQWPDVVP